MEISDRRAVLMDSNYLKLKNHLSNDHFGAFLLDLIEQVDCDVAHTELEANLRLAMERLRDVPPIWPFDFLKVASFLQNIRAV